MPVHPNEPESAAAVDAGERRLPGVLAMVDLEVESAGVLGIAAL